MLILSITAWRLVPDPDIRTVRRVGWSIVRSVGGVEG